MEKRDNKTLFKNIFRCISLFSVILVFLISTILPASAFIDSAFDSDVYAMPLDFVFTVERDPNAVLEYKLAGYLFTPLLDTGDGYHNVMTTLESENIANYSEFYKGYYSTAISPVGDRLLAIYDFYVDEYLMYDYGEQTFELTADASVIALDYEFVHLSTMIDSPSFYNAWVEFDYKIPGDTTVHHYEYGDTSTNFVGLIPSSNELGLSTGDLIYIYNYYASVHYDADRDNVAEYYPTISMSCITTDQKQLNTGEFITQNDQLLIGSGGPAPSIDNVWLLQSVTSFFNFEIFPGFSLGGVMGILFAITVLIAVLKFVAGG